MVFNFDLNLFSILTQSKNCIYSYSYRQKKMTVPQLANSHLVLMKNNCSDGT